MTIYNEVCWHQALGRLSPQNYRQQAENNTLGMSA